MMIAIMMTMMMIAMMMMMIEFEGEQCTSASTQSTEGERRNNPEDEVGCTIIHITFILNIFYFLFFILYFLFGG